MFDPNQHHRKSVRLPHYDYASEGAYFVTICAAQKRPVFGRLENGAVRLHPYGKIVEDEWMRMGALRANVELDATIVMPDHFHAIIIIHNTAVPSDTSDEIVGAQLAAPECITPESPLCPNRAQQAAPLRNGGVTRNNVAPGSLGAIVRGFKSAVTREINIHRAQRNLPEVQVWQRSFYDRIIRDEKEFIDTRRYIIENSLHIERHP